MRINPATKSLRSDKNGITYRGWLRGADGSMRYQTYIQPEGGDGYCLIVWRVQYIPESPDPDYPNDPAHNIPAGGTSLMTTVYASQCRDGMTARMAGSTASMRMGA